MLVDKILAIKLTLTDYFSAYLKCNVDTHTTRQGFLFKHLMPPVLDEINTDQQSVVDCHRSC